jgi:hypothetical protein
VSPAVVDPTAAEESQRVAAAHEATANHLVVRSRAQEAQFVVPAVKLTFKKK